MSVKSIKILKLLFSSLLFLSVDCLAEVQSPEELTRQCAMALEKRDFKNVRSLAASLYDLTSADTLSVAYGYANFGM